MTQNQPQLTIGIPTFEANISILRTLQSIESQTAYSEIAHIYIALDGTNVTNDTKKYIASRPKVTLLTFAKRSGQSTRINDLCLACKTPYLILTNDDVFFAKNSFAEILKTFRKTGVDLVTTSPKPARASNLLQKIISVGASITAHVVPEWNNSKNYLACNGRLLGLSKRFYSQLNIPKTLWNNDAYIYFFCKKLQLKHLHSIKAVVYYELPYVISEYLSQTSKFSFSHQEINSVLKTTTNQFTIPLNIQLLSIWRTFLKSPMYTLLYIILKLTIGFLPKKQKSKFGYWETDRSTKILTPLEQIIKK